MRQEHLAVGAFALLSRELAEQGCSPGVLSMATRAADDEVRHAEICRRFAEATLGPSEVPRRFRGLPDVPMHDRATASDRALLHVVEMCCLSETLTGVFFTEMLTRTTDPVAREVVESLLEDKIDHGRLGWAYLAERVAERSASALSTGLPAMIDRTFRGVLEAARRSPADDAHLEAHAYLGLRASADIYRRALRDVILPGFESLALDMTAARALMDERGWLC
jgi:hypothetical protein